MERDITLKKLLRRIINENSRLDVLIDKYTKPKKNNGKSLMGLDILGQIIFADPTTKKPQGDFDITDYSLDNLKKVQPGQYVNWMLRNFEKPELDDTEDVSRARSLFLEDLFKLTDDLTFFTKYKQYFPEDKRDINKYTPTSLFSFINNFQLPEKIKEKLKKNEVKKEIRKEREGFSHPGASVEYVGDDYTVVKIEGNGEKQRAAAEWYGGYYDYNNGESRWCTSPPNSSYFAGYIKDGPLYVILANNDNGKVGSRTGLPQERYQFHFPSNQYMDRLDRSIDLIEFLNGKGKDLKEYFKPEFAKSMTDNNNTKVQIVYPNSSSSKYVVLYGFEELIEDLSPDIKQFTFVNKGNEPVAMDIPSSIGKFKNLQILQLDNVVKTLPDEIGNLEKLSTLVLSNNPSLKSLPPSIGNLKKLIMINLSGSPKDLFETLPPETQEKFAGNVGAPGLYLNKT